MDGLNLGGRERRLHVLQARYLGLRHIVIGKNIQERLFSGHGCGLIIFCE